MLGKDSLRLVTTGINKHENPYYASFSGDSSWSSVPSQGFPKPGVGGSSPPEGAPEAPCHGADYSALVHHNTLIAPLGGVSNWQYVKRIHCSRPVAKPRWMTILADFRLGSVGDCVWHVGFFGSDR
jgi:hypothetical protein